MTAETTGTSAAAPTATAAPSLAASLAAELRLTLRILFRQPGFWVPTILFPAMLYAFFGASIAGEGPRAACAMASFSIYAAVGVGFYQFGVSLAQDRESPFAVWQRTLPGPAWTGWAARVAASLLFVMIAVAMVWGTAWLVAGLTLAPAALARLAAACVLASVPATLMGTALGSLTTARAAVPMANLIFLPLAYLGGLWVPPMALPAAVDALSAWTPTRAMGEIAWAAVGGRDVPARFALVLAGWTLAAGAVTWAAQQRHRRALFG